MRVRSFTVPFSKIAPDATELEFGPDDYLVVRPLFAMPYDEQRELGERMRHVQELAEAANPLPRTDPQRLEAEEAADQLILDIIRAACAEWHLTGPDGPIEMPGTPEALSGLPSGLAVALYPFLSNYRGEAANPTTPR